jgi:hypothetical protein
LDAPTRKPDLTPRLIALLAGLAGTLLCALVIYRTAQQPVGDGTGMQWVILGPLGLLFFGLALPALIYGVNGLRGARPLPSADELERREQRVRRLVVALVVFLVVVFGITPMMIALLVE